MLLRHFLFAVINIQQTFRYGFRFQCSFNTIDDADVDYC